MGANKKIIDLGDIARHGFQLGIECRCGHKGTIDVHATTRWFLCHGWSTGVHESARHFWCSACKRKGRIHRIGLSADTPADHGRFPATEEGWKRLVKRLRG